MNKPELPVYHQKLEDFYQGFQCGVRVNWDTCHTCDGFTVRSGWGEYCRKSEDFARLLTPIVQDMVTRYKERVLNGIAFLDNPYSCFPKVGDIEYAEEIARHYAFAKAIELITEIINNATTD